MDNLSRKDNVRCYASWPSAIEERASDAFLAGDVYGVVHCYIGQEVVAVGVCSAPTDDDKSSQPTADTVTVSPKAPT